MKKEGIIGSLLGLGLMASGVLNINQYNEIEHNKEQINNMANIIVDKDNKINDDSIVIANHEKAIKGYKEDLNKINGKLKKSNKTVHRLTKELKSTRLKLKASKQHEENIKKKIKVNKHTTSKVSSRVSNSSSGFNQTFVATFYTNHQQSTGKSYGDVGYGITASGTHTTEGRTIACPRQYPFGTKIELEGLGVRVCEDTGSAIVGNKIDVYVTSEAKAMELGVQKLKGRVLN